MFSVGDHVEQFVGYYRGRCGVVVKAAPGGFTIRHDSNSAYIGWSNRTMGPGTYWFVGSPGIDKEWRLVGPPSTVRQMSDRVLREAYRV